MSELTVATPQSLIPAHLQDTSLLAQMTNARTFLPSLKLYTSATDEAKEGKIPVLSYGITKKKGDPIVDLGKEPVVIPITYHFKALRKAPDGTYLMFHDHTSDAFKEVQKLSEVKDSGCMWGPEVLLFVPGQSEFKYVSWFLMAMTTRPAAAEAMSFAGRPVRLGSEKRENKKKQVWFVPSIKPASESVEAPDPGEMEAAAVSFNNVRDSQVVIAPTDEAATEAASTRD